VPDIPLKIQKSQIRFYPNQEIEKNIFKDILHFDLKCTIPAYENLPTYLVEIKVDPGTPITCGMINSAIIARVNEFLAQKALNDQKIQDLANCPGVTSDASWFYVTVSI